MGRRRKVPLALVGCVFIFIIIGTFVVMCAGIIGIGMGMPTAPHISHDGQTSQFNTGDYLPDDFDHNHPENPRTVFAPADAGRVHVKGYYRKDGTYVKPHTRSR